LYEVHRVAARPTDTPYRSRVSAKSQETPPPPPLSPSTTMASGSGSSSGEGFLPCLSALSHLSAFLSQISSHMTHRQYYSDFILPRQPNRNQHSTPQKLAPPHSSCEKTHGKQCLSWRCLSWHTRLCVYIQQTLCCDCYEKTHGKQSLPWRYLSWRCLPWHTRQRRRLFRVFAHTAYALVSGSE
jgi:hypothetical protein